jgi:hypothetical protein
MLLFFTSNNVLRLFLACLFLLYATDLGVALSEDEGDEDNPIQNVRHERQGRMNIFIEYDLQGEPTDAYTVTLTLKVKSDSAFSYTPLHVIGDIGANIRPGKNKRVSWRIADEYQPELDKEDVQFVVAAIPPPSPGLGSTELYIAGGAAVVGLAIAIAILSSGKVDEPPVNNAFPLPPGRPR